MATITDVAHLAGVSIKTVSRVINGEEPIRPETKARVNKAIEMLGYEPHRGARLMRSSKSGLIGIITGLFSSPDHGKISAGLSDLHILRGAYKACREAGKTLLLSDMAGDPGTVNELLSTFTSHRVEGIIYVASFHQQVLLPTPKNTPLVLVNCFSHADIAAVVPDDTWGQTTAVEHLVSKGHRRIGYIGLTEDIVAGRLRKAAFIDACQRLGLSPSDCPIAIGSSLRNENMFGPTHAALKSMLAKPDRPTALCFGNDAMAMHAYRLLDDLGIRLPQDMAIMGFDNDIVICNALHPQLSTVTLPYFEMGYAGVRNLLQRIGGETSSDGAQQLIRGEVIERNSTPFLEPLVCA